MDLFHDLGSVKYVKSRDSTELTEKKKKNIYSSSSLKTQSMFKQFFGVLNGDLNITN